MEKIKYEETLEFKRDLKKLSKKYRTLPEDLKVLKKAVIELYHVNKIDNNSVFPIPGFCNDKMLSYKVKKFASKSLKGRGAKTGLRLIYIFLIKENKVLLEEIYFKGVKENEDKERLEKYMRRFSDTLEKEIKGLE